MSTITRTLFRASRSSVLGLAMTAPLTAVAKFPNADGIQLKAYSSALSTALEESCAVFNNGNAKCTVRLHSNQARLDCRFLVHYKYASEPFRLDGFTLTQADGYLKSFAENPNSFGSGDPTSIVGSSMESAVLSNNLSSVFNGTIAEMNRAVVIKSRGKLAYHSLIRLDEARAVQVSIIDSLRPGSSSVALTYVSLDGDALVIGSPISCSRLWESRTQIDGFKREYKRFENPATLIDVK